MVRWARQFTDRFDALLRDKRFQMYDRDTNFTRDFDEVLRHSGSHPGGAAAAW